MAGCTQTTERDVSIFREHVLNKVEDTAEWATNKKMKGVAAITDE